MLDNYDGTLLNVLAIAIENYAKPPIGLGEKEKPSRRAIRMTEQKETKKETKWIENG